MECFCSALLSLWTVSDYFLLTSYNPSHFTTLSTLNMNEIHRELQTLVSRQTVSVNISDPGRTDGRLLEDGQKTGDD